MGGGNHVSPAPLVALVNSSIILCSLFVLCEAAYSISFDSVRTFSVQTFWSFVCLSNSRERRATESQGRSR